MSRNLFAVVLTGEQDKGAALISAAFGNDCYPLGDNTFVVASDGLSRDVAMSAGVFEDRDGNPGEVRGVVFKLNGSYTGYTRQSLWEWLEEQERPS